MDVCRVTGQEHPVEPVLRDLPVVDLEVREPSRVMKLEPPVRLLVGKPLGLLERRLGSVRWLRGELDHETAPLTGEREEPQQAR